jgi:hypothetical protein
MAGSLFHRVSQTIGLNWFACRGDKAHRQFESLWSANGFARELMLADRVFPNGERACHTGPFP